MVFVEIKVKLQNAYRQLFTFYCSRLVCDAKYCFWLLSGCYLTIGSSSQFKESGAASLRCPWACWRWSKILNLFLAALCPLPCPPTWPRSARTPAVSLDCWLGPQPPGSRFWLVQELGFWQLSSLLTHPTNALPSERCVALFISKSWYR